MATGGDSSTKAEGGGFDWDAAFSSDTEDEAAAETKAKARVKEATQVKEEGNRLLQRGQLQTACATYKRALGIIWALYRRPGGAGKASGAAAVGAAVDLNLALCHLKLEEWEAARKCASRALAVEPGNAKALYRRGL
eukprot:CAMPEP_0203925064 /NCGR_PEP_ID=MMETSP0359-20131031/64762_1 /ASSEMBLY_ACC=CAM_ASM_000338 /TAXON_ID=268821 /ORGANISM="Scrippsiella Hangoei, Strain SHTV-5" /LENGTH=136 /DNA_ID=CAMNT_0050853411 /DNA_START=47 /DNA_END=454 /DNA_ORIENTATION=-